ncbi:MAG: DNA repair protein RecN [Chitinophagales bacterium]
MLVSLEIKNYAIIQHVNIQFGKGLNIITGETGAGKSILVGALGLALGNRADTKVLYANDEKCVVEAVFEISQYNLKPFFEDNDIDFEQKTIIRREITANGKSRAFVNDTPVTLEVLKSLAEKLINLTSQHETQQLNKENYQIDILDAVAANETLLFNYKTAFNLYKATLKKIANLKAEQEQLQKDYDYNQFQFDEIANANLDNINIDEIEQELNSLNNAETIQAKLISVVKLLDEDDINTLQLLNEAYLQLKEIAKFNKEFEALAERINSSIIEIEDLKSEAQTIANQTEFDEEKIEMLTETLNAAHKLMRKHNVDSIADLMQLKNDFEAKLLSFNNNTNQLNKLEKEAESQEQDVKLLAQKLHESRMQAGKNAKKEIEATLAKVGMPNAVFEVSINAKQDYTSTGNDQVQFMFNANKGFALQPLNKIASGGEMSRVMLSIQALLAKNTALPTLIFDEIDTGISGETAAKVADVFTSISTKHQLIAITHLPQIAAKAQHHLFIYKSENEGKTATKIALLNEEKHITAIARMLSGEKISEESLSNAKQLIKS